MRKIALLLFIHWMEPNTRLAIALRDSKSQNIESLRVNFPTRLSVKNIHTLAIHGFITLYELNRKPDATGENCTALEITNPKQYSLEGIEEKRRIGTLGYRVYPTNGLALSLAEQWQRIKTYRMNRPAKNGQMGLLNNAREEWEFISKEIKERNEHHFGRQ